MVNQPLVVDRLTVAHGAVQPVETWTTASGGTVAVTDGWPAQAIVTDAAAFLRELLAQSSPVKSAGWPSWNQCCRQWKERYPIVLPEHRLSSFSLSVFYPPTVRSSLKLKLFLETLEQSFSGVPPWDQALIERGLIPSTIIE